MHPERALEEESARPGCQLAQSGAGLVKSRTSPCDSEERPARFRATRLLWLCAVCVSGAALTSIVLQASDVQTLIVRPARILDTAFTHETQPSRVLRNPLAKCVRLERTCLQHGRFVVYTEPRVLSKLLRHERNIDERAAWQAFWGKKSIILPGFHDGVPTLMSV